MIALDRQKERQVAELPTDAILAILAHQPRPSGRDKRSFPLGGLAHIEGIGQVPFAYLRQELHRRGVDVNDPTGPEAA